MTAEIVELDSLLEDFSDETCCIRIKWSFFGFGNTRDCGRPAAFMVRTNCRGCGPHRRFICKRHLMMIRAIAPNCAECGEVLAWVSPGAGDSL